MKKLVNILSGLIILTSCAPSKMEESSGKGSGNIGTEMQKAEIRQAVEMRRFLIKFDRLYSSNGGIVDLIPKANYILLDGDRVVISAAYFGRQYSSRPIKGIDMVGQAVSFEIKNDITKGYDIRMKVKNDKNSFDVFVSVSNDGHCNASLVSYRIDHVRYTGNFIPLKPKTEMVEPQPMVY